MFKKIKKENIKQPKRKRHKAHKKKHVKKQVPILCMPHLVGQNDEDLVVIVIGGVPGFGKGLLVDPTNANIELVASRLDQIDRRLTSVSTELANQINEISGEIDRLGDRADSQPRGIL